MWTTTEKQPTDGPCPQCGASGGSHVTTFEGTQVGRECSCGARFPIYSNWEQQPKAKPSKEYLGDGVYVEFDGFGFVLTTENGISTTNRIVLEPVVYTALVRYAERLKR